MKPPIWAVAVRDNANSQLRDNAFDAETADLDRSATGGQRRLEEARARYDLAWSLVPEGEQQAHDWLSAQFVKSFDEAAPLLAADRWMHFKVRIADRIIRETMLTAFETCRHFAPRMTHDRSVAGLWAILRSAAEQFLGTDAMSNRPKVRFSIGTMFRQLGQQVGPWVGDSIAGKRALSETFAHLALLFATDVWRFWSDADREPTKGYESHLNERWQLFFSQLVNCRIARDAAVSASQLGPATEVGLRERLAADFEGGEGSGVLREAWSLLAEERGRGAGSGAPDDWFWRDIFFTHRNLRRAYANAVFLEELEGMVRTRLQKQSALPRWSANRSTRWNWMMLGDELHHREFGHLFK